MSSPPDEKPRRATQGGIAGEHPQPPTLPAFVGPSTDGEFNTIKAALIPIACWRLDDIRFEFDSSFVRPEAGSEMKHLAALRKEHPKAPLSIFGHADPVGNDDYNKQLSGRRATAIYAMLIRNVQMWEDLYKAPIGGDNWGIRSIQLMLTALGYYNGPINNTLDAATDDAVRRFQRDQKLKVDGDPGPKTREKLFQAYMDKLCTDNEGKTFKLEKTDFLAQGADADGKGDYQGCSEFNPLLMFSQAENQELSKPQNKAQRDAENGPNRRVVVFLFRPGSRVNPQKWPCPRAKEGIADCKKRFWSDADKRRAFQATRREQEKTHDTFACRFYERISSHSPCEDQPVTTRATIEIITDSNKDHIVDGSEPVATFVRIGVWDNGYDAAENVRNNLNEDQNFVGADLRRFYFRVRDPQATGNQVTINWKTLKADKSDDDAPASQALTLLETSAGSKVFVSKAVMLVTDDTDLNQPTNSGLNPPLADTGNRNNGQSNHRTRRARIDGFVKGEYTPAAGGPKVEVELPVFNRNPDERRRVSVRVINYGSRATAAYISGQFEHANQRWNQVGIQIDAEATVDRPIPPGVLDATGQYPGSLDNPNEQAALNDLIPITPDNTVTAVFVPLSGANAYATIGQRTQVALGDRYFIFINTTLALTDETLAHELAHVLFNRFDTATQRRFFTLNTNPPSSFGITPLPDVRIYRRIQNLHAADPDNDPNNDGILNWAKRRRTARFPIAANGLDAPTATTGNTLTQNV